MPTCGKERFGQAKFTTTNNFQAEPAKFDPKTDVTDKKILSNGIFYGTNKVQQANVFSTVYGKAYLDPNYLLMTRAQDQNLRYTITIPTIKYTVIMMSDATLRSFGYDYNPTRNEWQYTAPGTAVTTANGINAAMQRMLAMHIIPTPNGELDNLSGSGIVETLNGEYIKYENGKFISAGSQDSGYAVTATGTKTATNGRVYYADKLLTFTNRTIGSKIVSLGTAPTSEFYSFAQLLRSSAIYNAATGDIAGVSPGVFYTVFVPDNAAVQAAATAGLLPKLANGQPNLTNSPAWTLQERDLVTAFIQYHFINKTTVVPDGKKTGAFETIYKKPTGDPGSLNINSAITSMQVTDNMGRKSNVIIANSNNLADRAVIHLIDNYLQYDPN